MGKYLDRAHELRAITEPHYNCTQAVLVPFAERFGLSEETAFNMGANFGGGMKSGTVCGVITGGLMVLGLAGFDQPSDAKNFIAKIREKHDGMMMCAVGREELYSKDPGETRWNDDVRGSFACKCRARRN